MVLIVRMIVKGGESECFRIDSGVRHRCIMSPWLFNEYMDSVMKEVRGRRGRIFQKDGREWKLPGLLPWFYAAIRRKA